MLSENGLLDRDRECRIFDRGLIWKVVYHNFSSKYFLISTNVNSLIDLPNLFPHNQNSD